MAIKKIVSCDRCGFVFNKVDRGFIGVVGYSKYKGTANDYFPKPVTRTFGLCETCLELLRKDVFEKYKVKL